MFRRAGSVAAWMLGLLVALPVAVPSDVPAAESAIRAAYEVLRSASVSGDPKLVAPLLAPDFFDRTVMGATENAAAYLADIAQTPPAIGIASGTIALDNLAVRGDTATVDGTYTLVGTYLVAGVKKPLRMIARTTDTWSLLAGAWKLRSSVYHELITDIDGRRVQDAREDTAASPAAIAAFAKRYVPIRTLALDAAPAQFTAIGAAIGNARIVVRLTARDLGDRSDPRSGAAAEPDTYDGRGELV